jgi:V/A-type H+-transporting ATPase subunit K
MGFILFLSVLLVLTVVGLGLYYIKRGVSGKSAKRILSINVISFFSLLIIATMLILSGNVYAEGSEVQSAEAEAANGLGLLAAGLSTGLATIGAGIAVAISGSAALGAISEDPGLLGKTLIFVGLAEGIAIYGLIVSILILGRL